MTVEATLDPTTTIPTQPVEDEVAPRPPRKSRSGTSRAERKAKAAAAKPERAPRQSRPRVGTPSLAKRLEGMFGLLALGLTMKCAPCGMQVTEGVPALAKALDDYSKTRPNVRRVLESACATSDFGPLLMAVFAVAAPVLAHHGGATFAPLGMLTSVMGGSPTTGPTAGVVVDFPAPPEHVHGGAQ